jgi:glycine/D-amino acid oxidase-like deaminating enzyme
VRSTAEVVVIGGGLEGLSVASALTARGVTDVVVLERGTVGSGFTAKSSGIIRCHYGVPSIAAMAARSLPVLEDAPEALGADIGFHNVGYLVGVGPENLDALLANVAAQKAVGVTVEMVGHSDVEVLFPSLRTDDYAGFAYEPRGGYADAYLTAQAFAGCARLRGARVRQGAPVESITASGDSVTGVVLADGEQVSAGTVVVAAGPWSPPLVAPLGVDLPIRTMWEQLLIVDPGRPLGPVPVLSDLVTLQYMRPEGTGHLLVGNSDHHEPHWVDPDDHPSAVDPDYVALAAEKAAHRIPALDEAGLVSTYTGCYDVPPDFNPVIGPTPLRGLYLCAGFAGHGYKISPAVGELMADIVLEGASRDPDIVTSDFRLERFAEGRLLESPHPYIGAGEMR